MVVKKQLSDLCKLYRKGGKVRYEFDAKISGCEMSGEMYLPAVDSEERFLVGTGILFRLLEAETGISLTEMEQNNLIVWRETT